MNKIREFLMFRSLVTPALLQILFWAGIGGCLYGTWWLYTHDNWAWMMSISFGPLLTRVIFESLILRFRTYDELVKIHQLLADQPEQEEM